jgi:ferredoxin--NADP+ reductase
MAYVITQSCCSDATCVRVCPVNCIHPTPDEPDFGTTEMLYVDGDSCIDCGACADACPVDAIKPAERLTGPESIFAALNDAYYARRDAPTVWGEPAFPLALPSPSRGLRVAVVGTGPSASYAAEELLHRAEAEVTMIDRLPLPGGLVRGGVAPDHQSTKQVGDTFASLWDNPRVTLLTGVEVGRDVTRAEILEHHHAVVYASGASSARRLDVPGEDLAGSLSAVDVVRWYNADPAASVAPRLATERAVVVGTGNVALDVARLLTADPSTLAATDIAQPALDELTRSTLGEVLVLARRGPEHAAYTVPELLALAGRDDVDLVVADEPRTGAAIDAGDGKAALLRDLPLVPLAGPRPPGRRRVVLAFHAPLDAATGCDRVDGIAVRHGDRPVEVPTGLVVAAVGYRGRPVPDLPFDEDRGTVPHERGRVRGVPGCYVTGWVKRGPSGGIGANRADSLETVDTLLEDLGSGPVRPLPGSGRAFRRLVRRRRPQHLGVREVLALDGQERARGRAVGRPRVKGPA